jgi:hypothetical protein
VQRLRPVSQQPPSSPPHKQKRFAFAIMSHSYLTADSTSNFQLIINNALKAYESHTKKDLLVHPLAAQFQACNSPADILAILQRQVQALDQSRSNNDRWTKWLDPTVSVLYALSETLGEGVALVSLRTYTCLNLRAHILWQVFSPAKVIFAGLGVLLLVRILLYTSAKPI